MEKFDIGKLFDYYLEHPTIQDHTKKEIEDLKTMFIYCSRILI